MEKYFSVFLIFVSESDKFTVFFQGFVRTWSTTYNLVYFFIASYFFWQINLFRTIYMLTPSGFNLNVACR